MKIQVMSAPVNFSASVGTTMVGIIFTDAIDRVVPGTFFVPMATFSSAYRDFSTARSFRPLWKESICQRKCAPSCELPFSGGRSLLCTAITIRENRTERSQLMG
jgi:hypothetical protein